MLLEKFEQNVKGYLGDIKLKRSNQVIDWTPELLQEYVKCSKDPIYFVENYVKIINVNNGLQSFDLYKYQKDMINSFHKERNTIVLASRQPLDIETELITPNGFKKFKDIHANDIIYDNSGKEVKVISETDIMYDHECFNIEFCHGEIIKCDVDHPWTVELNSGKEYVIKVISTKELKKLFDNIENKYHIRIKCSDPLRFNEQELLIEPYLFGLWLGSGDSTGGIITGNENDISEYVKNIKEKYSILAESKIKQKEYIKRLRVYGLTTKLKVLGVYKNKHIPDEYIYNSIENRLALIQGLLDSDGSVCSIDGTYHFHQQNIQLINQIRFILSTLGVKSSITSLMNKNKNVYNINFCNRNFDFFRLNRKLIESHKKLDYDKNNYFYIKTITEVDSVPVKCISVDNETHLFLCGNTLIPTHNSGKSISVCAYILWYVLFNAEKTVALLANDGKVAREMLSRVQFAYEYLPKWLQQGILEWNKGSIQLENSSRVIAAATTKKSVRGFAINLLYLDETAYIENWEEFSASVMPTISSGSDSKIILSSTPWGLNHFHALWVNARAGINNYKPIFVNWRQVPGRDEKWKEDVLATINHDVQKFECEYECVDGSTIITLRDKDNGEILNIPINSLFYKYL